MLPHKSLFSVGHTLLLFCVEYDYYRLIFQGSDLRVPSVPLPLASVWLSCLFPFLFLYHICVFAYIYIHIHTHTL